MTGNSRPLLLALCGLVTAAVALQRPVTTTAGSLWRLPIVRRRAAELTMRGKAPPGRLCDTMLFRIDEAAGGDTEWRLRDAIEVVQKGGCGVIPTDTSYSFITRLSSREGVQRILRLKGQEETKKPLSLMCADLAMADRYVEPMDKKLFKLLKRSLPGPYTFVLRASANLPKLKYSADKTAWKRREIGVRIPDDGICACFLHHEPLLCSTVPLELDKGETRSVITSADDEEWSTQVDFIVDAGPRQTDGSTVYSFINPNDPVLLRAGMGDNTLVEDW